MIDLADLLMIAIFLLITIALLLACALRIVCRGAARVSSPAAVADDPFFFPFGDMPTVPRERHLVARDFRAWGIPQLDSAGALRRNESGGRPASTSGTAVVLSFPKVRL
jgi:hypothetical protein